MEILNNKGYRELCNGNRVKKLKANGKLFELRVNRGDRLLFTFNKSGILFLSVGNHDEAIKMGIRQEINNAVEIEAAIEDIVEVEVTKIIDNPIYDNINESDIKKIYDENRELYKLTSDQEKIVNKELPIFLYGSAGSGKTTMLIKKIESLLRVNQRPKVLFLTNNRYLLEYTKRLYETYSGYETEQIDFRSVNEFFQEKLGKIEEPFGKIEFEKWFEEKKKFNLKLQNLSVLEVHSEIRGILKGFVGFGSNKKELDETILDKEKYLMLKGKYSLLKSDEDKELVYKIAKEYQKYLESKNRYDENDLAIRYLKGDIKDKYDFIACDEVQDLTEVQILAMLKSAKNIEKVFLTGDNNQAINLSYFDFSRLKTLYHEEFDIKDIENSGLWVNLRSCKTIVETAKR